MLAGYVITARYQPGSSQVQYLDRLHRKTTARVHHLYIKNIIGIGAKIGKYARGVVRYIRPIYPIARQGQVIVVMRNRRLVRYTQHTFGIYLSRTGGSPFANKTLAIINVYLYRLVSISK